MNIDAGQGSRDRAVLFGVLRMFLEGRRRHLGDRGFRVEIDPMDGPLSRSSKWTLAVVWMLFTVMPAFVS